MTTQWKLGRTLVTGGAGFLGSHLVRRLSSEANAAILVLDNLHRGERARLSGLGNVQVEEGDIRDRSTVERAMAGIDTVFHLAAQSNVLGAVADLDYSFTTNVQGTFEVLRAAHRAGVRRVVFTSSREVYGDPEQLPVIEDAPLRPKNAYGASKVAGELYCEVFAASGLDCVVLRLANVYGPGDRGRVIPIFLDCCRDRTPLTLYGGQQLVDFVWVDTVVDALLRTAADPAVRGPLNIGSGQGITVADLATRIQETCQSESAIQVLPARDAETTRFVADVHRAMEMLHLPVPRDPLQWLPQLCTSQKSDEQSLVAR